MPSYRTIKEGMALAISEHAWDNSRQGKGRQLSARLLSGAMEAAGDLVTLYESLNGATVQALMKLDGGRDAGDVGYRLGVNALRSPHRRRMERLGTKDIAIPTFRARLDGDELIWDGEDHPRGVRNPEIPSEADYLGETLGAPTINPSQEWWIVARGTGTDESAAWAKKIVAEEFGITGRVVNHSLLIPATRSQALDAARYVAKRAAKESFYRDAVVTTPVQRTDPPGANESGKRRPRRNPACPACGAHIASGSATCPSCGIRVRAAGETATPLESPKTLVTRRGRPPGVPVGNPGAYVRVARMPTDDELAHAWSYIEREYTLVEGDVDGEQWAEGLAFGQRFEVDAMDHAVVREVKPQLTEVQWRQISRRADELLADQGEPLRFKE